MAKSLNESAAKSYAPAALKPTVQNMSTWNLQTFLANDKWSKRPTARWVIGVALKDIDNISKDQGLTKKTAGTKRIIDWDLPNGYKIRFEETGKTLGSKAPDAKTTRAQELGSAFIFRHFLAGSHSAERWQDLENDTKLMAGLNKIWKKELGPKAEVDEEWIQGYFKQYRRLLQEFGKNTNRVFDHSGTNSFMEFITQVVRKNFGVSKKDNWNPADIWMIKGSRTKLVNDIETAVYGSKDSQTIEQLNAMLRGMYKERRVVGISLKKISGQQAYWEEYNVEQLTTEEVEEYRFPVTRILIDLGKDFTKSKKGQDTSVFLEGNNHEFKFQIKANTSTEFSGLKWEATPKGATKARAGKAQVDYVLKLLEDNKIDFKKASSDYPQNVGAFNEREQEYKDMFDRVNKHPKVTTHCTDAVRFAQNMVDKLGSGVEQNKAIANSKLMQLTFLDDVLKLPDDKYDEFWTDITFLSIKRGDRFGPFGKLY